MNIRKPRITFVATRHELTNPTYGNRLWRAARNMNLSRRKFQKRIENVIYDFHTSGGIIMVTTRMEWKVPTISCVMGGHEARWLGFYLEHKDNRPKHIPRSSTLERRRILDLYFRIEHPEMALTFG